MKPIDFRNAKFDELKTHLAAMRERVWRAWLAHGPGTTRAVAARAQIDLLTFRPRSTELFQLGVLALVEGTEGHEGIYQARTMEEWEQWFQKNHAQPSGQLLLV